MKLNNHIIAAVMVMFTIFGISAQNTGTTSPYSKYGYGLLNDNATSAQRSMGGVGYAMNSGRQINVMNPASYASIDTLTFLFDMGVDMTTVWSKENGTSAKDFGGGLDYITMQFPLGKRMGGSFGLLPYSSVGYSFGSEIAHGTNSRQGYGGLNQLYLGLSGRIIDGLTVGTNISYLFGTTVNDMYAYTDAGSTSLFERVMQVRDWHIQLGVQYSMNFDKKNRATVGLVYTPGKTLLGHTWGVKYDITSDAKADTIGYTSLRDKYSLPDTWGIGLNYQWDNKLMAEVDFTYQGWKNAKTSPLVNDKGDVVFEPSKYDNRWKIAAGVQYTPNMRGNYVQRMNYRIGGFYNHDYILVGENNLRDYGVSIGFGFPTMKSKTVINLGFEYRHRQANPNPLIKEDYFNITLGVNFNELWFWQNKIR